jgi:hypothetical protein
MAASNGAWSGPSCWNSRSARPELEVEQGEAGLFVGGPPKLPRDLHHEDLQRGPRPAFEQMPPQRGAVPPTEGDVGVEPGTLLGHGQIAQEGQDLGVPGHWDAVVLAALGVEVSEDRLAERADALDPRGAQTVLPGERGQALDGFLAAFESDQEGALRLVQEEARPQGTGSQADTLGWSLSTAPTWAAPPGEV